MMILIEDTTDFPEVEIIDGRFVPWKVQHQVEVVELDTVFGDLGIHPAKPVQFLVKMSCNFLRPLLGTERSMRWSISSWGVLAQVLPGSFSAAD